MERALVTQLFTLCTALIFGVVAFPVQAEQTGLLVDLFKNSNSKTTKSSSTKKKKGSSTTSSSKKKKSSSSNGNQAFLAALTGKTAEEREKEAYAKKKAAEARAKEEAKKKARDEAEKAKLLAEKKRAADARKQAREEMRLRSEKAKLLAARMRAEEEARKEVEEEKRRADMELVALAHGRKPGGFGLFGRRSTPRTQSPTATREPSRYLYINEREISSLNSSNSRVEIDLGDQRARVYKGRTLVIETQVSTGKSGYSTPTGRFSIKEKLVDKQSGRYGTWFNASGVQLQGDDARQRPPGGSRFVGAEMPYWLRLTGGIGMHVGFVPDGPASHGCIRVPSNVQPLIFSKVRVGTMVTVKH